MGLIGANLKAALQEPGCPLCTLRAEAERRYIESMLHESVNDSDTRRHIVASLGYCPAHILMTARLEIELYGDPLGNTIIYQHLVGVVMDRLRHYTDRVWQRSLSRGQRWLARFWPALRRVPSPDELQPLAQCRVCQCGEAAVLSYSRWLLEALSGPGDSFRELYTRCGGLCLLHLRQVFEAATWPDRAGIEFLVANTLSRLDILQRNLQEYTRKQSWQFRDEPKTEAERDSWQQAVDFFGGS